VYFLPEAEVIHFGGASAPSRADLDVHLCRGRYQFVAKHQGATRALAYRLLMAMKQAKGVPPALLRMLRDRRLATEQLRRRVAVLKWLFTLRTATGRGRL